MLLLYNFPKGTSFSLGISSNVLSNKAIHFVLPDMPPNIRKNLSFINCIYSSKCFGFAFKDKHSSRYCELATQKFFATPFPLPLPFFSKEHEQVIYPCFSKKALGEGNFWLFYVQI